MFLLDKKPKSMSFFENIEEQWKDLVQLIMGCVDRFAPEQGFREKAWAMWILNKCVRKLSQRVGAKSHELNS